MTVSAVGAVTSGVAPVYAAYSPYLNGVRRTSDAAAAAAVQASAVAASAATTAAAIAARAQAAATVAAAPPFLNPAIAAIADETALGQAVIAPVATTPNAQPPVPATPPQPSPTDSVAYGDSGLLVQSYGAVALLTGPLALTPAYGLPPAPAVSAVAKVAAYPRVTKVDVAA